MTYEHYLGRQALTLQAEGVDILGDVSPVDIDRLVGAKTGDPEILRDIRDDDEGVDGFITRIHRLMGGWQAGAEVLYENRLDELVSSGRIPELLTRRRNVQSIELGSQIGLADPAPGRWQMAGVPGEIPYNLNYDFLVTLWKAPVDEPSPPLRVFLDAGTAGTGFSPPADEPAVVIPAGRVNAVLNHRDANDDPTLRITRQASAAGDSPVPFSMKIVIDEKTVIFADQDEDDDKANLESEVIEVGPYLPSDEAVPDPAIPTRWVYRGFSLRDSQTRSIRQEPNGDLTFLGNLPSALQFGNPITKLQRETVIMRELNRGFFHCPILTEGMILGADEPKVQALLQTAKQERLADMRVSANDLDEREGFFLHPEMTDDELMAIAHVGGFVHASVSTGTFFEVARRFSIGDSPPIAGTDYYILVAEVPLPTEQTPTSIRGELGINYVTGDFTLANGNRPSLQLNSDEGSEVTFLTRLRFQRAYLYKIEPGALPGTVRVLETFGPFLGNPLTP